MGRYADFDIPHDIVMVSTADWDEPLWTNKQQIASRLVEDFRVLYIEPLASLAGGKRGYSHRYWRDACGVHVLRPPGVAPFGRKLRAVNEVNHRLVLPVVRERLEQLGFKDYILWLYQPSAGPFLDLLKPAVSCYDCVDEYSAMPGAWIQVTRQMERDMIKRVDVVFTTARSLYEDKCRHNPNTHFVPNVADFKLFNKTMKAKPAKELKGVRRPIIGYVGAMNYKLDDGLLERLFSARPDWSFVFVGPDRGFGVDRFMGHKNVHFLGRKTLEDLPSCMAAMDLCLIPYKIDRYTRGVLPMKHYEYLASGRPVVSTRLPELEVFDGVIDLGRSALDLVELIEWRLANDTEKDRKKRIALARENSWEKRINTILEKIEEAWKAKNKGA